MNGHNFMHVEEFEVSYRLKLKKNTLNIVKTYTISLDLQFEGSGDCCLIQTFSAKSWQNKFYPKRW